MGAMIVQHPELARAVLSEVGVYDTLREEDSPERSLQCHRVRYESRTPNNSGLFTPTHPIHHVEKDKAYPAVFLTADADDTRVNPMQSRKMAAALQWATSGTGVILLHTTAGVGHGVNIPVDAGIATKAAAYAFLFRELGMGEYVLSSR